MHHKIVCHELLKSKIDLKLSLIFFYGKFPDEPTPRKNSSTLHLRLFLGILSEHMFDTSLSILISLHELQDYKLPPKNVESPNLLMQLLVIERLSNEFGPISDDPQSVPFLLTLHQLKG